MPVTPETELYEYTVQGRPEDAISRCPRRGRRKSRAAFVWNRGGLAGELVVEPRDAAVIAAGLASNPRRRLERLGGDSHVYPHAVPPTYEELTRASGSTHRVMKEESMLRISKVTPLTGFDVRVNLTDGHERVIDLRPHMKGPIFEPLLRDPEQFKQVRVEAGTLSWPGGQDLCPDVLLDTGIAQRIAARLVQAMPAICTFDGITIYVYSGDHPPPHVHAKYSGQEALIVIVSGKILEGEIPKPQYKKVRAWLKLRRAEVSVAFVDAQSGLVPDKVPPP